MTFDIEGAGSPDVKRHVSSVKGQMSPSQQRAEEQGERGGFPILEFQAAAGTRNQGAFVNQFSDGNVLKGETQ